jgi:SAM-dependent methyltransferase
MGLGLAAIQNTLELWQQGLFQRINSVAEIGSQEIHTAAADFQTLVEQACVPNFKDFDFPGLENWPGKPRCSARYFYRMLGATEYDCIDLNEEHGAIRHDLNYPLEEVSLYGKYDLVTDHGSCEHVFNIAEAYRTIHRLCKVGGLIVISQSLWGGNGYFLYDRPFFEGIAAANGYRIIYDAYVLCLLSNTLENSGQQFHIPLARDLLKVIDLSKVDEIGVYAVLQKQEDTEFQFPYQGEYLAQRQQHAGFKRLFYRDPAGYSYVPEYSERGVSHIPGSLLVSELGSRIKKKFFWSP